MSFPKRSRNSDKYPDWQNLPIELSTAIAKRVTLITDYVSFRGVCTSWRSAATFDNFDREFPRIPWLMYVTEKREKPFLGDDVADKRQEKPILGDDGAEKREEKTRILGGIWNILTKPFAWARHVVAENREEKRALGDDVAEKSDEVAEKRKEKLILGDDVRRVTNFLDLESKTSKITNLPLAVGIPYLSWSGWILYVSNDSVDVYLTHPVWRVKIRLPCLDGFPPYKRQHVMSRLFIRKMVLSGSPTIRTDLVVMVIWGDKHQLGFSRPVDRLWTVIASWDGSFCDIVYHDTRLYAVDSSSRVVECDVHGPNPTQIRQVFVLPETDRGFVLPEFGRPPLEYEATYYLVESSGKILIVSRHFFLLAFTTGFRVFEIDLMHGSHYEIHYLGNRALFLGCNSSICVELFGCSKVEPNRVYFMNDIGVCKLSGMGVYRLLNKRTERMNWLLGEISDAISPTATWVVPSF